jgi:hypothetical protein
VANPEPTDGFNEQPLSKWGRIFAGAIGVIVIAAGSVAVYKTSNQLGSAVLVVVGAVFLVMAMMGVGIKSITTPGGQILLNTMRRAAEYRDQGNEEAAEDLAVTAIGVIGLGRSGRRLRHESIRDSTTELFPEKLDATAYETEVISTLINLAAPVGFTPYPLERYRFDCIIRVEDMNIGIEVRAGTQISPEALAKSVRARIASIQDEIPVQGVLVVIQTTVEDSIIPRLAASFRRVAPATLIWAWRASDGAAQLQKGINMIKEMAQQTKRDS